MGMFDNLRCEYPLPDKEAQNEEFQTKTFNCFLDLYIITKDGDLILYSLKQNPVKLLFHGDIIFYTSMGKSEKGDFKWFEYCARFSEGKLKWIKQNKILKLKTYKPLFALN